MQKLAKKLPFPKKNDKKSRPQFSGGTELPSYQRHDCDMKTSDHYLIIWIW